jgi:catechol 2,3-dioxygenase-like lactoylglutathione lyase family enzyme
MTKYLHTMIRVSSLEDSIAFFEVLGLHEIRRRPDEKGRYTNVFLAVPGDEAAALELTYNWDLSARRTASPSSYCRPAVRCRQPNPGPACPTLVPGRGGSRWHGNRFSRRENSTTLRTDDRYRIALRRKSAIGSGRIWRHILND